MSAQPQAAQPFIFHTRLNLSELTGLRARTLKQMVHHLKSVPDSCIYHHTHRFLQQHQYLSPEPPNDFSYWVSNALGERDLAEDLASVDTVQFETIAALREKIIATIETHLESDPDSASKFANKVESFYFIKSVSIIFPTSHVARSLGEFADSLKSVTVDSLYYHIFEARLRLGRGENDFSYWLRTSLGEARLADAIARLDPYTYTLDELRTRIVTMVERRIKEYDAKD